MQSKLPVRIKKKREKTTCNNDLELTIQNSGDSDFSICTQGELSLDELETHNPKVLSISTQTETSRESERKSYGEVKCILVNINNTLETILETLQDKKESLYNKLQEEGANSKRNKLFCNKTKIDRFIKRNNQLIRKFSYDVGWPDISRLYCDQSPWLKNYMQKIAVGVAQHESNMVVRPRSHIWMFTARPRSCPNINYFQPMGNLLERRNLIRNAALVPFRQDHLHYEHEYSDEREIQ